MINKSPVDSARSTATVDQFMNHDDPRFIAKLWMFKWPTGLTGEVLFMSLIFTSSGRFLIGRMGLPEKFHHDGLHFHASRAHQVDYPRRSFNQVLQLTYLNHGIFYPPTLRPHLKLSVHSCCNMCSERSSTPSPRRRVVSVIWSLSRPPYC